MSSGFGPLYTDFDRAWAARDTQAFIRECLPNPPNPLCEVVGFDVKMVGFDVKMMILGIVVIFHICFSHFYVSSPCLSKRQWQSHT